ncbi:Uncharacterised protein [Flavonifractor plautii]|uniref:Uncharacterized protein n=1 Tax=Flavonifractor plautii TaxID=292800 RepID=A0A174BJ71_FLAPL|nr:Uncharacterised protein [Flavonifractor plautii]
MRPSSRLPPMPGGSWWIFMSFSFTGSTVEPLYFTRKYTPAGR